MKINYKIIFDHGKGNAIMFYPQGLPDYKFTIFETLLIPIFRAFIKICMPLVNYFEKRAFVLFDTRAGRTWIKMKLTH